MTARTVGLLSVVAPVFNEADSLDEFYRRTREALDGVAFELVLVDDGSSDGSSQRLERLAASDPRVKTVFLSRNFGHQPALTAGLDHARGDAVVMLDCDLQDPPELIPEMLRQWQQGADVVYAVRRRRDGETPLKLVTARWFYRIFRAITGLDLEQDSGDFRLLDRSALDALRSMREHNRFLRGMSVWVGFTQTAIPYDRHPRHAGETKFTLSKMLRFSTDAILSFSHRPLQVATLLGMVISTLSFIGIPVVIALKLLGMYLPGFSTLEISILLLGGIQLITIGIIGEYVGRIFDEVKDRPLYLVRAKRKLSSPDETIAEAAPEFNVEVGLER